MTRYLMLAALLAGFSSAHAQTDLSSLAGNAKQEKQVVWYTTTSGGDNQAIVAGFTKKYPFLKVEVLRSTGEKLRQRILTETSAGQFFSDVASVSSMEMGLLKSKNLLQAYDPPEAEGYPAATKDKEKFFTAIYARNFVMGYNTAMVPEKDRPKDWPDLLDPKWKGRFGMDEEEFEWYGTLVDYWGREKAGKYMKALAAQQPTLRRGHNLLAQLLAAGEFPRDRLSFRSGAAETTRRSGRLVEYLGSDCHIHQCCRSIHQSAPSERGQAADQLHSLRRRSEHYQKRLARPHQTRRQTQRR